jgi:LL-diaminopimelate aminotransferase
MTSLEFTAALMKPETAVVCMPGSLIAEPVDGGLNPGEGYARFALTPELDAVERAAARIAALSF